MLQPTTRTLENSKEYKTTVYQKLQGKEKQFSNANHLEGEKWISVPKEKKRRDNSQCESVPEKAKKEDKKASVEWNKDLLIGQLPALNKTCSTLFDIETGCHFIISSFNIYMHALWILILDANVRLLVRKIK